MKKYFIIKITEYKRNNPFNNKYTTYFIQNGMYDMFRKI